jgi:hypothetical protein
MHGVEEEDVTVSKLLEEFVILASLCVVQQQLLLPPGLPFILYLRVYNPHLDF